MDEEDLEGIDENDELYAVAPKRVRRLIGFDWASGYVSPFRPTDDACAHAIMLRAGAFQTKIRGREGGRVALCLCVCVCVCVCFCLFV
jgi:hypothetical protein